ncbi:hypothetical protein CTAYLR_009630 [Chrysophaeum taylorii]|uniref:PH domain-containing protein n=1 Tax=Chrysophaeum taylorii TaxID=2483200 RepID=A0AAD7XPB5_9STRA|nr:hypothetical protein CTAYLR_009630 [Chrysophaeum taylorii]
MGASTSSAAADEKIVAQNIGHFDHPYDAVLVAASEEMVPDAIESRYPADVVRVLGEGRIVCMTMKFEKVEVHEMLEFGGEPPQKRTLCTVAYQGIKSLDWDHAVSSVKITVAGTRDRPTDSWIVLRVANSLELESEAKLRLRGLAQGSPSSQVNLEFHYVGVFAGPTKPKPFQRKRANLSKHEQGKLPPLGTMRDLAVARHTGSGAPTRANQSKRLRYAMQEIHKGSTSFTVVSTQERGRPPESQMLAVESRLTLSLGYEEVPGFEYVEGSRTVISASWDEVKRYEVQDRSHQGEHANGVQIEFQDGKSFYFVVLDVLELGNAVQYYWNRHAAKRGREPAPRSTHGRDVVKVTTLEGEIAAPPRPRGDLNVVDEHAVMVREGRRPASSSSSARPMSVARRKSTLGSVIKGKKPTEWRINPRVEKFWDHVVRHQGWLLKKGGVAKTWMKRYAVLYSTAMGHFLCYYADFAKSPLFHSEERERRVIDLSKTTFVRPVSNNKEAPTNSFDICTIEREWTLSAESKASMQQWLRVITRAIDEDVAIVPDDELVFVVKPRVDPSMQLVKNEYSTALKVSASGVAVCHVSATDDYVERFFWCYTDFFKWSILHHSGKTGLQVSVFTSADFDVKDRHEFLFRTRDAVKLATAIEFYIEKFMAAMHLYLEGSTLISAGSKEDAAADAKQDPTTVPEETSAQLNMATREMGQDAIVTDDLLGHLNEEDDDDDTTVPGAASSAPAENSNQDEGVFGAAQVGSILDLFTVDEGSNNAAPADPSGLHAPDDPFAPKPLDPALFKTRQPRQVEDATTTMISLELEEEDEQEEEEEEEEEAALAVDATEAMLAESPLFETLARLNQRAGTLYENDAIAVSVEQEYRGSQGRLILTVRNEETTPLEDLALDLDVGASGLRYHVGDITPSSVPSDAAASTHVMLECMQPYDEAPVAVLSFLLGNRRYHLRIALPSLFTKFLEAVDLAPQVFVQRWATLGSPGLECMRTFGASAGPATAAFAKPRLETLLNIAFAQGVDDANGTILSGAAALRTGTANAGGDKISVGCLVRLEMNDVAKAYRLTVRTAVPRVSEALTRAIHHLL